MFSFNRFATVAIAGLLCSFATIVFAHPLQGEHPLPPWQQATPWPDRIMVTLNGPPQSGFAVTWRTDDTVTETIAQIAVATEDARFDKAAETVLAATEPLSPAMPLHDGIVYAMPLNEGVSSAHFHSVTFTGLTSDTVYAYRVRGAEEAWSEWFQVKTAATGGPVKFIYIGDAQNGVMSHWSRLVRAGYAAAPNADFILHAGDLINRGSRDLEWAEWFKAVSHIHGMIPAMPVAGNHEYARLGVAPHQSDWLLSIFWRPQFTLPVEDSLPADLQEVVYDIRYSRDVHIFVLSTQSQKLTEQANWLDAELGRSDARWKIVSMHHPVFSSGKGRDSAARRKVFLPVLLRHSVDLVLQGHDHTYARGDIGQKPESTSLTDEDKNVHTVFVTSVSGPKQYPFKEDGWDMYDEYGVELVRRGENTPFYQVIKIDGDSLEYEAYTILGRLYDDFIIQKKNGQKVIMNGSTPMTPERTFGNTGPYSGTGYLK